jgi:hypothetical protein
VLLVSSDGRVGVGAQSPRVTRFKRQNGGGGSKHPSLLGTRGGGVGVGAKPVLSDRVVVVPYTPRWSKREVEGSVLGREVEKKG